MKCHVQGCESVWSRSSGISFYRFTTTTSSHIKEAWRKFCGNLPDHVNPMVCARHFQPSDFWSTNIYGKSRLKRDVIPSIKPEEEERCFVFPGFPDNEGELEFQLESLEAGMELPENVLLVNEEGEQYILSDNVGQDDETPTLILAGGSEGEELLLDEEELFVLEDHPMEVSEDIPPLMTFDGRLVSHMDESGDRDVALVREALALETAPESPPSELPYFVESQGCNHKTKHEANLKIIKRLEKETRSLSAGNDVLASTKRRMRSEIGRVQKTFGGMFTANQMNRIQGVMMPWQKKDFHRAVSFKLLGPKAYRFLKEKYEVPLPSLSLVNTYEQVRKAELTLVYDEVKAVKAMVRNMRSQNKD